MHRLRTCNSQNTKLLIAAIISWVVCCTTGTPGQKNRSLVMWILSRLLFNFWLRNTLNYSHLPYLGKIIIKDIFPPQIKRRSNYSSLMCTLATHFSKTVMQSPSSMKQCNKSRHPNNVTRCQNCLKQKINYTAALGSSYETFSSGFFFFWETKCICLS